ncbi:YraN family protein [Komagataeibacter melaceti]|uniref:YraN family protein n=1 Tax=Komagataeibacter melaceti TaxID=2766577 RepID=A0A371Z1Q7_9PROT|nr:YraN family protein [Komagataeibacter melaceti]RFD20413.1 YraN family protein [Komagataeibacter melaceti]
MAAEHAAMADLKARGWQVLLHRARTRWGEIDLVALHGSCLVFVEVKARPSLLAAGEAIRPGQVSRIMNAARYLCAANPDWVYDSIRFDVCAVLPGNTIEWIPDAFRQF